MLLRTIMDTMMINMNKFPNKYLFLKNKPAIISFICTKKPGVTLTLIPTM